MENESYYHLISIKSKIMRTLFLLFTIIALQASATSPILHTLDAKELMQLDLNGKFAGKRFQYTADQKGIMQTFIYEFNLKQEGSIISGTSTIINDNGDYADMLLRGSIVGDKVYFEEYSIKSEIKPDAKVWCFKSGALNIRKDDFGNIKLIGATPSFIPEYYYTCTGGYTDLTRNESAETVAAISNDNQQVIADEMRFSVFPNPFLDKTSVQYKLTSDAKVSLEIMDILGKRIALLENNVSKAAGDYTVGYQKNEVNAGVYIAKLTVNGEVFSQQIVQVK